MHDVQENYSICSYSSCNEPIFSFSKIQSYEPSTFKPNTPTQYIYIYINIAKAFKFVSNLFIFMFDAQDY